MRASPFQGGGVRVPYQFCKFCNFVDHLAEEIRLGRLDRHKAANHRVFLIYQFSVFSFFVGSRSTLGKNVP